MDRMKTLGRKIMLIAVVIIMVFTIGLFGASCSEKWESLSNEDFDLTISVNLTTLDLGQNIEIEMIFKNKSGRQFKIEHGYYLMILTVNGNSYNEYFFLPAILRTLRAAESIVERVSWLGSTLSPGSHMLAAKACFTAGQIRNGRFSKQQYITVKSNEIKLTVA